MINGNPGYRLVSLYEAMAAK